MAGILTAAAGLAALVGWAIGIAPLKSLITGLTAMRANSALGFVLCGASLTILSSNAVPPALVRAAKVAATLALLAGLLTFAEQGLRLDLGIDTLLFHAAAIADGGAFPGRMSPGNAICLIASGAALLALRRAAADWLAAAVAVLSLTVVAGYGYSLYVMHRLASYTSFSLPSALAFVVLSTGILCAGPDRGFVRGLYAEGPSGTVLRRLIPAAVIIPMLLAWLSQEGERIGMYDDPVGIGVMVAAIIMAFVAVIRVTARSIDASDTRRARAEVELDESQANYRDLFDAAPVGLSHSLRDGTLLEVNHAFVHLMGYADAASLRRGWATDLFVNSGERAKMRAEVAEHGHVAGEVELRRADGAVIWVQLHSRMIKREDGPPRNETAFIDITQRKQLEQQFVQAQKMEAVGRLAGGVAHDFNNLLTVIRSYCDLVLMEMPENAPIREDLREISGAADRAAALARQLLAFSRKQVLLPQVINPNVVVQEVHSMLRRVLPSAVACEMKIADDLGAIRVDPGQVDQVLMNLAINASDAMPGGGRLLIETSNCTIDAAYARLHSGVQPGEYVCIAVSDTGTGIDQATLAHIFEPFFTTKPVGKGTGLGLATVYGIVEQNHGHVWVYSEPGEGTTFKVYFPLVDESPEAVPKRALPAHERAAGPPPVVLVVEDDDAVRGTIAKVLGLQGYTVLSAQHGGEGMRVGTAHTGAIDLVISDVMMPEMGGRDFVERLAKVHPESRVLLISGYTDDDVLRRGLIDPAFAFLEKPFTVDQLVRKVQGVLGAV